MNDHTAPGDSRNKRLRAGITLHWLPCTQTDGLPAALAVSGGCQRLCSTVCHPMARNCRPSTQSSLRCNV